MRGLVNRSKTMTRARAVLKPTVRTERAVARGCVRKRNFVLGGRTTEQELRESGGKHNRLRNPAAGIALVTPTGQCATANLAAPPQRCSPANRATDEADRSIFARKKAATPCRRDPDGGPTCRRLRQPCWQRGDRSLQHGRVGTAAQGSRGRAGGKWPATALKRVPSFGNTEIKPQDALSSVVFDVRRVRAGIGPRQRPLIRLRLELGRALDQRRSELRIRG